MILCNLYNSIMEDVINRLDPCCGASLKRGTTFIAIIDMVNSIGIGMFAGFGLFIVLFYGEEIKIALDKDKAEFPDEAGLYEYLGTGFVMWVLLIILLTSVLYFLLAQTLLHGAKERDAGQITRWLQVTVVLLCLRAVGLAFGTIMATNSGGLIFIGFLYIIYTVYCLWVVHRFRNELSTEEAMILRQWNHQRTVHDNVSIKN